MTEPNPYPQFPVDGPQPGAPSGGYLTPPQFQTPVQEPLISPDYSGWWSRAVNIVKRGWKPLLVLQVFGFALSLVFLAPVAIWAALTTDDLTQLANSSDPNTPPDLAPVFGLIGLGLLAALLTIVLTAIVTVATVHVGVSVAMGAEVRLGDALALAVRRVFPLLGWQLLAAPIYLVGLCLCILPVFYVASVFLILPVVVAVERTNAISRCFSLFHRNFGPAFARAATILGLTIAVSIAASLIGSIFDSAAQAATPGTAGLVTGSIISTLFTALLSGALAILVGPLTLTAYADVRALAEPVTTLVIAQELGVVTQVVEQPPYWTPPPADPFTGPTTPPPL